MWVAWSIPFVCGVALVQGATLKDKGRVASGVDSVHRRSLPTTSYRPFFDWNKIADNIIQLAKEDIIHQGKTNISLPAVWEEKPVRWGLFSFTYELRAYHGSVGNLDSFRRSGDVLLTKERRESLQGDVPITLDRVTVRYGQYNLKVIGLDFIGELEETMDTVSFLVTIYGEETDLGCTTTLKDVKVTNIGKIGVKITGFYGLDGIVSSILGLFLEARKLGIVSAIERVLVKELGVVFQEYQCDEIHSLFLLAEN